MTCTRLCPALQAQARHGSNSSIDEHRICRPHTDILYLHSKVHSTENGLKASTAIWLRTLWTSCSGRNGLLTWTLLTFAVVVYGHPIE